jgi:hypothetical protein
MNKNILPFLLAGILLILAVLLAIPASSQALLSLIGIQSNAVSSTIGGFDAFIPFIPGYFPEGFVGTSAGVTSDESRTAAIYGEFYASDTHFFKTIQSQNKNPHVEIADPDLTIQGNPTILTSEVDAGALIGGDLDLADYDTSEVWLLTVVMREIQVQVVSNAPKEEVIRFAEGLIPQRCTSTPTPDG